MRSGAAESDEPGRSGGPSLPCGAAAGAEDESAAKLGNTDASVPDVDDDSSNDEYSNLVSFVVGDSQPLIIDSSAVPSESDA